MLSTMESRFAAMELENRSTVKLAWTDRISIFGLSLMILGFTYTLHRDSQEDRRQDMQKMTADMKEMNQRWVDLLKQFHSLDKDVEKLRKP